MSFYVPGVPPVDSTQGTATNPTTATIVAELLSTQISPEGRAVNVAGYFYLGSDTAAVWWVEHCVSSGLGSTALAAGDGASRMIVRTVTGSHSQFVRKFHLGAGDRIRVRMGASLTGSADAKIQAEVID